MVAERSAFGGGARESMSGFVSHYTNRLDAKGRVSVPAPFRQALTRDGFEGLYCFPSLHQSAVDAGGHQLVSEIQKRLDGLTTLTEDHDALSTALFGASETLKIDGDGRVMLSDMIREHVPDLNLHVLPNVGHWAMFEGADDVNRLIIDFHKEA